MKQIQLSQGQVAVVDDDDYEELNQFKWHAIKNGNCFYAIRNVRINNKYTLIGMHRFIMKANKGQIIDHMDGDGINNQKSNLRFCTRSQNGTNSKACGASKYLGVSWCKTYNKWRAMISINGKLTHIGYFMREIEAALSYNDKAKIHHGDFARLNVI